VLLTAVCSFSAEWLLTMMLLRWSSASRFLMQVIEMGDWLIIWNRQLLHRVSISCAKVYKWYIVFWLSMIV
jgi:hypothetical protein